MKGQYNIRRGDLTQIAKETGLSYSMVKKVSSGVNRNASIEKILIDITKQRNASDLKIVKKLGATK